MTTKYRVGETRYYLTATRHGFEILTARTRTRHGEQKDEYEFCREYRTLSQCLDGLVQLVMEELDGPAVTTLPQLGERYHAALSLVEQFRPAVATLKADRAKLLEVPA